MSLVMVLISALIMGIIAVTLSKVMSGSFSESKHWSEVAEIEDIRAYLRTNIDCAASFSATPAVCNTPLGGTIPLTGRPGVTPAAAASTIIKVPTGNDFTRFGKFAVRAWCGNHLLRIDLNRLSSLGDKALPDPMTGNLLDGTKPPLGGANNSLGWKNLFPGVAICVVP
jgi:type II secretory pathway pseudopilin PulG